MMFGKYFVRVFPASLLACVPYGFAETEKPDQEDKAMVYYQAVVGAKAEDFARDDVASATSGGDPGGTTILWLNGDPIDFYNRGFVVKGLNQWMRPGKNALTLSGKHKNPVYIKISKSRGKSVQDSQFMGISGKRIFHGPGTEKRAEPLEFQGELAYKLPEREELKDGVKDRERYEKEIQEFISELNERIHAHKGQHVAPLLHSGELLWAKAAYGYGDKQKDLDESSRRYSDPKIKLVDEHCPLQLLFGKCAVLAYRQTLREGEETHYSLIIEDGMKKEYLGPLQLARVGGKWVVWNLPSSITVTIKN